jgi:hypothetical protein
MITEEQIDAGIRIIDGLLEPGHKNLIDSRNQRWSLGVELEPMTDEIRRLAVVGRSLKVQRALLEDRRAIIPPFCLQDYLEAYTRIKAQRYLVELELYRIGESFNRLKIKIS